MAKLPLSAQRWISAAASSASHSGHHGQRDQGALARAGGPLVDHPVVVGLHAQEGELLVLALEEGLPAEAGERVGEVDGRVHMVGGHVGQPRRLVPRVPLRISSNVVETEPELLEADGGRHHHEGGDQVVVVPDVAPLSLGSLRPAQRRSGAALGAPQHLHLLALDARPAVLVAGRQPRGPQVRRLDDVIVHGDDHRWLCHGLPSRSPKSWSVPLGCPGGAEQRNPMVAVPPSGRRPATASAPPRPRPTRGPAPIRRAG